MLVVVVAGTVESGGVESDGVESGGVESGGLDGGAVDGTEARGGDVAVIAGASVVDGVGRAAVGAARSAEQEASPTATTARIGITLRRPPVRTDP
ncbi:MAG: hypothetical protein H0U21_11000 [Acidimicrobiia bacterium]|nr:hypothetical protein [Acidimicrobiia bacterium]